MMRKEELLNIARISGMKPHQQEKHYVQVHLLRALYSRCNPVFKGGTALMLADGLNRFSEDLDFTASGEIGGEEISTGLVRDLALSGIRATKKDTKGPAKSVSFKIGAEGPLFMREIERCHVRIEISLRERVSLPPRTVFVSVQYPDMLPFQVSFMALREIAAEKVRAVMTRNKARDVFDLLFVLGKRARPSVNLIDEKLRYYKKSFDPSDFLQSVESKRGIWKAELAPIVFGPLPDFGEAKRGISRMVEGLAED